MLKSKVDTWINENGCPEYCSYCIYSDNCPGDIVCYGCEPVEPGCVGREPEEFIDIDALSHDIECGNI